MTDIIDSVVPGAPEQTLLMYREDYKGGDLRCRDTVKIQPGETIRLGRNRDVIEYLEIESDEKMTCQVYLVCHPTNFKVEVPVESKFVFPWGEMPIFMVVFQDLLMTFDNTKPFTMKIVYRQLFNRETDWGWFKNNQPGFIKELFVPPQVVKYEEDKPTTPYRSV